MDLNNMISQYPGNQNTYIVTITYNYAIFMKYKHNILY